MYQYIVQMVARCEKKFLERVFKFSHLLIRGLIKEFSPN